MFASFLGIDAVTRRAVNSYYQYYIIMRCKYSCGTWTILVGMIVAGALRSVAVKLAYQSGFKAPLTVTLLSFLGKTLAIFAHWTSKSWAAKKCYNPFDATAGGKSTSTDDEERPSLELGDRAGVDATGSSAPAEQNPTDEAKALSRPSAVVDFYTSALRRSGEEIPNGSDHGLSGDSEETIRWVHRIPFYARPAIPAILNLVASALRWTSLVWIDASVVEMMVAGLELVLGTAAARIFRKRMVSGRRWAGVVVVSAGVILIERANSEKSLDRHSAREVTIGVILILIQSILSVFQDLSEEIFLQFSESHVPAILMLGVEGAYGFVVGAIIYSIIYSTAGENLLEIEDIGQTIAVLRADTRLLWWCAALPLIFLVSGIFNIKATGLTSAMTRNVWKTLRTIMVWLIALAIYYLGSNSALGEAWHVPESFVILLGFIVMTSGIILYYSHA